MFHPCSAQQLMETNNSEAREECQTPKERSYCDAADTHPQDPLLTQKISSFLCPEFMEILICTVMYCMVQLSTELFLVNL